MPRSMFPGANTRKTILPKQLSFFVECAPQIFNLCTLLIKLMFKRVNLDVSAFAGTGKFTSANPSVQLQEQMLKCEINFI